MRVKLNHFVVLAMAFSILTGSVGMAATERFCAMLGVTPRTLAVEEIGCCSESEKANCPDASAALEEQDCCFDAPTHQKLALESALKIFKLKVQVLSVAVANPFPIPHRALPSSLDIVWPLCADPSPPLAGRDLLTRLHILNI